MEEIIITLVHGTFAKNASWVREDSNFCFELRSGISEKIVFCRQIWSGSNSHKKRLLAANELSLTLKSQLTIYPTQKKYIISHSHGGNIALHALKLLGNDSEKFNLITLGTPYLIQTPRDYHQNLEILGNIYSVILGILLFVFSFVPLVIIGVLTIEKVLKISYWWGLIPLFIYILAFIVLFVDKKIPRWKKKIFDNVHKKIELTYQSLSLEDFEYQKPIFVIYSKKDEIKMYFARLFKVWESFFFGIDKILKLNTIIAYSMIAIGIFGFFSKIPIAIIVDSKTGEAWEEKCIMFALYLSPIFGITCLFSFTWPILMFIMKSNPLALGWENFYNMFFIRTIPDIKPHKQFNFELAELTSDKKNPFSFWHSLYRNKQVIKQICHRISKD